MAMRKPAKLRQQQQQITTEYNVESRQFEIYDINSNDDDDDDI